MPYLIALGAIVAAIAAAIFKVNQWQEDKYIMLAQQAKKAEDAEDADDAYADGGSGTEEEEK